MYSDKVKRRKFFLSRCRGVLLVSVSLAYLSWAHAAEYPTKTIQIVNPFPPGGTTDIVPRILTDKLYSVLGQQVVVVNKAGGGGAIGMKTVKDAAADGYTVLVAPPPLVQIPLARKDIGFTYKDFAPINLTAKVYFAMLVKKDAPWRSLEEIIADAKSNPGKLTWGTAGSGTSHHFTLELFKMLTGADLTHVPLGGETPGNGNLRRSRQYGFRHLGNRHAPPSGWHLEGAGVNLAKPSERVSRRSDHCGERISDTQPKGVGCFSRARKDAEGCCKKTWRRLARGIKG
jgi:tripartite-type tricarboxylate transporter receptor subunit TctC